MLYNFDLPDGLIAQAPANPRDSAKLLVYDMPTRTITDAVFCDIDKYLAKGSTITINNSKVENCRWIFGNVEVFVLEKSDPTTIRAMVRPGKKFREGKILQINDWLSFEILAIDEDGIRTLRLSVSHDDARLADFEHIPLPPYIEQNDDLAEEYQTVYAKPAGSLAAPTAGLHFTNELLTDLGRSHEFAEVTLHVGLGTFAKLTQENIDSGKLHEELFFIDAKTADTLSRSNHLTAVGTTTIRTLESAYSDGFQASSGSTDIFITPGYSFAAVDSVVTNFHLPSTSLLMLVAAFLADKLDMDEAQAERELMRIYKHAIDNDYRFYSFGDAMLIV